MLLFLSLTGLFLSILLLIFSVKRLPSSWYLGAFFFLVSQYALIYYILVESHSVWLTVIFFIHPAFLLYLTGPVLFIYVRSVLTDQVNLRRKDLWHLLPAVIFFLSTLPYLLLSGEEKTANATLIASDIINLKYIRTSLLQEWMHPALIFVSRPLLVLFYAVWSLVILIRWLVHRQNDTVLTQQRYMIQWLFVLLGFVFILTVSHLIAMLDAYYFSDLKLFFTLKLLHLFSGIGLTGLLLSPLFFPSILYGMPKVPENRTVEATQSAPQPGGPEIPAEIAKEPLKQGFEEKYLRQIGFRVDSCMEQLKPYLQADCNIACLARLTNIPAHHLAYYFREIKHQPFNEYRNIWRVNHAKKMLREGKSKELTLEAIGLLSGFSTRNTFYTAFKKIEGVSPSVYSSPCYPSPNPSPKREGLSSPPSLLGEGGRGDGVENGIL